MPAGRPSLYSADMLKLAKAYIKDYADSGDLVPMAAGMACELGVTKKTLYNWADDNPEFLHTLEEMNAKQERLLASGGLSNAFNSAITKLMLHNHDYSDKAETDNKTAMTVEAQITERPTTTKEEWLELHNVAK